VLHLFISNPASNPDQRRHRRHPVLISTALHAMLLGIVLAPARPARIATPARGVMETVHYMTLTAPPSDAGHARASRRVTRAPRSPRMYRAPRMPGPPRVGSLNLTFALSLVSSQPMLPDVGIPTMVDTIGGDAIAESPFASSSRGSADMGSSGKAPVDSLTYIATDVDRSASLAGVNPKPAYPADLLRRSIEASFSVYFVVDTTGRVDIGTIQVPLSVEPRFAQAVREVLIRWRFVPAEIRGHRVRQLMEQTFKFKIISGQFAQSGGATADELAPMCAGLPWTSPLCPRSNRRTPS
jgi:TonB family protein